MGVAYSYVRFSSPQQASGDSLRRQGVARDKWLADRPEVALDQSLKLTDAGRSAFKRKDFDAYALSKFLGHVRSGRVEEGSYLLVENLDRISRESVGEATELFLSIVNRGIVVVQLTPVVTEFKKPVDLPSLMYAVMELSRGHSESAIKSERLLASWGRKQREAKPGRIVTHRLPGWISAVSGKLILNGHAPIVREIFQLIRDGHSTTGISRILNDRGTPTMGLKTISDRGQSHLPPEERRKSPVKWSSTLIWHVVRSRACIGEYTPYRRRKDSALPPVKDYFPSVTDKRTFDVVQGIIDRRAKVGRGRRGQSVYLFSNLIRDARDGMPMSYWNYGGQHPRVICPRGGRDGSSSLPWVSFPAAAFETAILSLLREIKAKDLWPAQRGSSKSESLAGELARVEKLISVWTGKMDDPDIVDVVATKLAEYNAERRRIAGELAEAQRAESSPMAETWGGFRSLAEALAADPSNDLRLRVKLGIQHAIEALHILIVPRGRKRLLLAQVGFRTSPERRTFLIAYQMPYYNGKVRRPERWKAYSQLQATPTADLRNPAAVVKATAALNRMDVVALLSE